MATSSGSGDCPNILATTENGFPKMRSLKHILSTRFRNGMPEEFIAIIMRDVLTALSYLHDWSADHNDVNSSNICVDTEQVPTTVKLAVVPDKHLEVGGEKDWNPTEGLWGLGITALEAGYGSLPKYRTGNERLVHFRSAHLANHVIRILKLKLAKNKGKEKLESADDQKLKEKAMQKGKGNLVIDDDQEMKEKATQEGKGELELADDPTGEEMAEQKGKETLEVSDDQELKEKAKQKGKGKSGVSDDQELKEKAVADEEPKKSMITFPVLEKLLDIRYVERLEKKLTKYKAIVTLTETVKKAMKKLFPQNNNADEREFSRDFLEVVLMCLDTQDLTPSKQILEHRFFQKASDRQEFDNWMRSHTVYHEFLRQRIGPYGLIY